MRCTLQKMFIVTGLNSVCSIGWNKRKNVLICVQNYFSENRQFRKIGSFKISELFLFSLPVTWVRYYYLKARITEHNITADNGVLHILDDLLFDPIDFGLSIGAAPSTTATSIFYILTIAAVLSNLV